jgi:uncharacterized oxidoreductase
MSRVEHILVEHRALTAFVETTFMGAGSSPREAGLIAEQLVGANLAGHDSHGVGSLPVYLRNVGDGELPLNCALTVLLDSGPLLMCNGNGGAGQVMGHDAIERAIAIAQQHGACVLGLRNSHHLGRIGHWAEQCARAGMVSIHFVNVISTPSVAPFGGVAARLGTNPFAIGIPRAGQRPIIVDFATSKLAVGKVRVALNSGLPLPAGALLTHDGEPTTDPAVLFGTPKGVLLPFGEHKGWGLGLACELLGAALSGGETQSFPKRRSAVINNMLTIVVSPERLGTEGSYFAEIERFVAWALDEANRDVLLPGDPEAASRAERIAHGIPIDPKSWSDILAVAAPFGAVPPEIRDAAS